VYIFSVDQLLTYYNLLCVRQSHHLMGAPFNDFALMGPLGAKS